jgi:hypothetical protein
MPSNLAGIGPKLLAKPITIRVNVIRASGHSRILMRLDFKVADGDPHGVNIGTRG